MNGGARLRVLLVQLEFTGWHQARSWAYGGSFGLVEGLAAHGVDTFILPAFGQAPPDAASLWLRRAAEICGGQRFDQVWIWLVHAPYEESFLDWVSEIAPVRVGWVCESLGYEAHELAEHPHLGGYRDRIIGQMRGLTHVVAVDESDVDYINSRGIARAAWWPACVPQRFIFSAYAPPASNLAAFHGVPYSGERRGMVQRADLQGLLVCPQPPEEGTGYPERFDELHRRKAAELQSGAAPEQVLNQYVDTLRAIRQEVFSLWLESLKQWSAVVNLPTYVKAYAGRVTEAMAAGRPVISWGVPNRPRTKALFEDGREILLFDRNDPSQLAEGIRSIQHDPELGRRIAEAAREKIVRYHTAENRVRQILEWVHSGTEPDYGEDPRP